MSPARWTATRAEASRLPSARTVAVGSAPLAPTTAASEGPGTNAVASHGSRASVSAPSTGTTHGPVMRVAASASRRKRARNAGSAACSARITLTATSVPPAERAR
ncbi:hypothetical protein GCM10010253_23330 [Streptomyces badius]|uniref:Uncharacterized protein n=1 Tax=Streptomyces badius TaxID=1941 RepID=A0ABQ2T4E6_STRBA|nr:hypothetical protein GCM10010253_23330 [Streptomyces badius]